MKLTLNRKFIQSSVFALGLCLGSASANAADKGTTYNSSNGNSNYSSGNFKFSQSAKIGNFDADRYKLDNRFYRNEASGSAVRKYNRAVGKFHANKLDEAERDFKSVLDKRRIGRLEKLSNQFLVIINHKQGDIAEAQKYVDAYKSLE